MYTNWMVGRVLGRERVVLENKSAPQWGQEVSVWFRRSGKKHGAPGISSGTRMSQDQQFFRAPRVSRSSESSGTTNIRVTKHKGICPVPAKENDQISPGGYKSVVCS